MNLPNSFHGSSILLAMVVLVTSQLLSSASAQTILGDDWSLTQVAMNLSSRVYLFRSTDSFEPFETYYESDDEQDAVAVAVYPDKCVVAFRGTKPIESTAIDGLVPDITTAGVMDIVTNLLTATKQDVYSKTNVTASCTIGSGYHRAYFNTPSFEEQIDQDCVANELPIYFTGHSQGVALAQIAAARYAAQQPKVFGFAPAPTFFGECALVPDDRIINFVNTETEGGRLEITTPVQFDIIPFADVFLDRILDSAGFIVWQLLPQEIVDRAFNLTEIVVGSYKGEFYILNPNEGFPSAAYVSNRSAMLDSSNVGLDVVDWSEVLDFSATSYSEKLVSAHDPHEYEKKIAQLYAKDPAGLAANGFQPFTYCNPDSEYMCAGFCPANALCSTGASGEPCFYDPECDSDDCAWVWEDIPVRRCV